MAKFTNNKRERAHLVHEMACKFSAILGDWLSRDESKRVIQLNRDELHDMVCHTHDFCDSNMAMLEAFQFVMGRDLDGDNESDCMLWNDAWNQAVAAEFFNRF